LVARTYNNQRDESRQKRDGHISANAASPTTAGGDRVTAPFNPYLLDEPVALLRNGLNVAWAFAVVSQGRPQTVDPNIEAVVEIHIAVRPEDVSDLFACD
jgi:hypothetical protein